MESVKHVATDYVGFQVGSSLVNMRLEYKDSPFRVIFNSIFYRMLLKNNLPEFITKLFAGITDQYFREIVIDFVGLSVMNLLAMNVLGDKKSYSKTVIKTAIQSLLSGWTYSMIKK
jgi:hypothetical protein